MSSTSEKDDDKEKHKNLHVIKKRSKLFKRGLSRISKFKKKPTKRQRFAQSKTTNIKSFKFSNKDISNFILFESYSI